MSEDDQVITDFDEDSGESKVIVSDDLCILHNLASYIVVTM